MLAVSSLGLLLVFALACGGGGGQEVKTYKKGEDAKVGKVVWRVDSVEKSKQLDRKEGGVINAQGVFVLVEMELKNAGSEPTNLTGQELELLDEENKSYSFDSQNNGIYLNAIGKPNLISGQVAAGGSAKGFIIFDISQDAKGLKAKAHDVDIRSKDYVLIDLGI